MLNAIITCTGKKGSGKTTKLRALVRSCRRALFADPEAKWPLEPGDVEVRGAEQLVAYLGALGATDPAVPFRVVYRDDAERMKLAAPAIAYALKNCTLCVDEWAWLCTAQSCPVWLMRCLQFGRERRVNLVGTTRRPQEITGMLFDQADLVLIFHTDPGLGLDRLRRWYPDLGEQAPRLTFHQYLPFGDESICQLLGREGLALPRALLHPFPVVKTRPR